MKRKILLAVLTTGILMISAIAGFGQGSRDEIPDGAVYAMTNAGDGNQVVVFDRDVNGVLTKADTVSTGGKGSGVALDPLGSQGSLVLSQDQRWLLAVNAGSNEISVFRVLPDGIKLVDKVNSGGVFPVSLAISHDLVYVLNSGASPNITGFILNHNGQLVPLTQSTRTLVSTGAFGQVGFDPDGDKLIVTDKADSNILIYAISHNGLPVTTPVISPSNGSTPFGFIFDPRGHLLVVEVGPNAVSSYNILRDNTLQVISPSVLNGQMASCWIAGNNRGYVFTANAATHTVSAYKIDAGTGSLTLLNGIAGTGRIDLTVSADGRFLYALDPPDGTIDTYKIERDGSLTSLGAVPGGFSIFAQGVAAR